MADDPKIKRLEATRAALHGRRGNFMDTWQRTAEVVLPNRANFTVQQTEGAMRTNGRFDSTGMMAHRDLKTAMSAMLIPKSEKWLFVRPEDPKLDRDDDVLMWCQIVETAMWHAIYDKDVQFLRYSGEANDDVTAFGQAHLFMGLNQRRSHLTFRSFHIKDVVFKENEDGIINQMFRDRYLTADQIASIVPKEKLPKIIKEELAKDSPDPTKTWRVTFAIYPNDEYDPYRADYAVPAYGLFRECVYMEKHGEVLKESGYSDFPVATPRWDTSSEETQARSPAQIALGSMLSLQQIGKTLLKAGHMAVEPPIMAPHNAVVDRVKLFPGGVTYYMPDKMSGFGQRAPLGPLVTDFKLPYGRDIQKDERDQVWLAFFRNVLHLPIDGPQMTAYEVAQRNQEFIRTVGPIFGRLESDYPAAIAVRVFNIMQRERAFPPPPDALAGRGIKFDFLSPVYKVLEQSKLNGARQWLEDVAPLAATRPHVLDHLDEDEYARDAAKIRGLPQNWVRRIDDVKGIRDRRAEMEQMEAMKQDAERAAGAGVNAAKVVQLGADAKLKNKQAAEAAAA